MKTGGVIITALTTAVVGVFAYDQYVKFKQRRVQQRLKESMAQYNLGT